MKNLTLLELDKHMGFLQTFSVFLKETYANKMDKCYIYNAPFIISNIISMISLFIDAETLKKIEIVFQQQFFDDLVNEKIFLYLDI